MLHNKGALWAVALAACAASLCTGVSCDPLLLRSDQLVHAFYYLWYGTPAVDGAYKHWDHEVLPHWQEHITRQHPAVGQRFRPPGELHSPYYPLLGPYSSSDPAVLARHFRELKAAGVGAVAVSWWGPAWRAGTHDTQGVSTDERLPLLLRVAEESQVAVAFHLEPYPGRSAHTVREDLLYLMRAAGASPALLRIRGRPLYYVYDSYHIPPADWAELLLPGSNTSLRGTEADGVFIGLWLNAYDGDSQLLPGGWDGAYTYFASEAVSYGADPANWPAIAAWARRHGKLFIPSVSPGYDDSRIRPWNAGAKRSRQGGERYRRSWEAALAAVPGGPISITSFNEWGEGTQIEPARVFVDNGASSGATQPGVRYDSYGSTAGDSEWLYLNLTLEFSQQLQQQPQRQQQEEAPLDQEAHGEL